MASFFPETDVMSVDYRICSMEQVLQQQDLSKDDRNVVQMMLDEARAEKKAQQREQFDQIMQKFQQKPPPTKGTAVKPQKTSKVSTGTKQVPIKQEPADEDSSLDVINVIDPTPEKFKFVKQAEANAKKHKQKKSTTEVPVEKAPLQDEDVPTKPPSKKKKTQASSVSASVSTQQQSATPAPQEPSTSTGRGRGRGKGSAKPKTSTPSTSTSKRGRGRGKKTASTAVADSPAVAAAPPAGGAQPNIDSDSDSDDQAPPAAPQRAESRGKRKDFAFCSSDTENDGPGSKAWFSPEEMKIIYDAMDSDPDSIIGKWTDGTSGEARLKHRNAILKKIQRNANAHTGLKRRKKYIYIKIRDQKSIVVNKKRKLEEQYGGTGAPPMPPEEGLTELEVRCLKFWGHEAGGFVAGAVKTKLDESDSEVDSSAEAAHIQACEEEQKKLHKEYKESRAATVRAVKKQYKRETAACKPDPSEVITVPSPSPTNTEPAVDESSRKSRFRLKRSKRSRAALHNSGDESDHDSPSRDVTPPTKAKPVACSTGIRTSERLAKKKTPQQSIEESLSQLDWTDRSLAKRSLTYQTGDNTLDSSISPSQHNLPDLSTSPLRAVDDAEDSELPNYSVKVTTEVVPTKSTAKDVPARSISKDVRTVATTSTSKDVRTVSTTSTGKTNVNPARTEIGEKVEYIQTLTEDKEGMITRVGQFLDMRLEDYVQTEMEVYQKVFQAQSEKMDVVKQKVTEVCHDVQRIQKTPVDLSGVQNRLDTIVTDTNNLSSQVNEVCANVSNTQEKMGSVTTDLQSVKSTVGTYKMEFKNIKTEAHSQKLRHNTLMQSVQTVQQDISSTRYEMQEISGDLDLIKNDFQTTNTGLESVKSQMELMKKEMFMLKGEVSSLKTEVKGSTKKIEGWMDAINSTIVQACSLPGPLFSIQNPVPPLRIKSDSEEDEPSDGTNAAHGANPPTSTPMDKDDGAEGGTKSSGNTSEVTFKHKDTGATYAKEPKTPKKQILFNTSADTVPSMSPCNDLDPAETQDPNVNMNVEILVQDTEYDSSQWPETQSQDMMEVQNPEAVIEVPITSAGGTGFIPVVSMAAGEVPTTVGYVPQSVVNVMRKRLHDTAE